MSPAPTTSSRSPAVIVASPLLHDEELVVVVAMERRPAAGRRIDEDHRDPRSAVFVALEPALLKKLINTADFVCIRYLEAGVAAARAIGRVTSATSEDACRAARQLRQR